MISRVCSIPGKLFGWPPPRLNPARETAWLDGVRGVAAFLVMINHYSMEWLSPFSDAPFGAEVLQTRNPDMVWYYKEGERLKEPWRLPILRVFMCSGNAQVAVFFVLSGFVLSWSPLTSVRAGRHEKLYQSLGSSTIRRWFRLFLPCFIVSVAYLINKLIEWNRGFLAAFEEIWFFIKSSEKWANPFELNSIMTLTSVHPYNFVMWTIPFEFSGSIFVFVTLLGLGRIRRYRARISCSVFVTLYALMSLNWGYWLFGSGLVLADYVQEAGGFKRLSQRLSRRSSCLWFLVWIVGLLLMGYEPPNEWFTTPGDNWISALPLPQGYKDMVGRGRFWWGWGGILFIASSCHLGFVRRFYESAINQYLGRISFMLYLNHILIDVIISKPLRAFIYDNFSAREFSETFGGNIFITTPLMNVVVHFILWSISLPVAMSLAHFMEIYIDQPCTRFGKWVDQKLTEGVDEAKPAFAEQEQLLRSAQSFDLELHDVGPR